MSICHANAYFGPLAALQDMFRRPIDLLETRAVKNPYVLKACEAIFEFTRDMDPASYETDLLLRCGVERQLTVISEAVNQAMRDEPEICEDIAEAREIVNLRNVLVHDYAVVENATIWGILQGDLRHYIIRLNGCFDNLSEHFPQTSVCA